MKLCEKKEENKKSLAVKGRGWPRFKMGVLNLKESQTLIIYRFRINPLFDYIIFVTILIIISRVHQQLKSSHLEIFSHQYQTNECSHHQMKKAEADLNPLICLGENLGLKV